MCYYSIMSSNKTIVELEKRVETLQSQIVDLEESIGRGLFVADSREIQQQKSEYNEYEEKKKTLQNDIEHIRSLESIQSQLKQDLQSIEEQKQKLFDDLSLLHGDLGKALIDVGYESGDQGFNECKSVLQETKEKRDEVQHALDELKLQMEGEPFFSKILSQFKYAAKKTTLFQLDKKTENWYEKLGKIACDLEDLFSAQEAGMLSGVLREAYVPCYDIKRQLMQLQEKQALSETQFDQNKSALEEKGVLAEAFDKRIKAINSEIDQEVVKQKKLCQTCGHDFVAKYVDPEGEVLTEFTNSENVSGVDTKIFDIRQLRREKLLYSRKIQIIKLTDKIESEEKLISSYEGKIQDNVNKITALEEKNKELHQLIENSTKTKEELMAQRHELETLATTSMRIEA